MESLLESARQSLSSGLLAPQDDLQTERFVRTFNTECNAPNSVKNSIITSRFTVLNFLPKAFFEQFRRLANVYFLVIGIIALVGTYTSYYNSAVEPAGILLPMTVVVLISVAKDGVEDVKRHRTDALIDARPARRVAPDGAVEPVRWDELAVGTVVLLLCDDSIPADVVAVSCGGIQGPTAYVETAAIDGESNLKIRLPCYHAPGASIGPQKKQDDTSTLYDQPTSQSAYCPPSFQPLRDPDAGEEPAEAAADYLPAGLGRRGSVGQAIAGVDEEAIRQSMTRVSSGDAGDSGKTRSIHDPNQILVSTDKTFVHGTQNIISAQLKTDMASEFIGAFNGSILFKPNEPNSNPVALSGANLLLRGSVLRAMEWCVGIVAFTGAETKVALNSKRVPSKLSSLDRVVNKTLAIAIGVMIFVCGLSALFGMLWDFLHDDATYLCLDEDDQYSCESSSTNSTGLSIFTFATLYNNFVCISMYVSLEMIYLAQSYFISQDLGLYDASTDTPAEVHSSGLCADLGQVQYILSDKTGTITKNVMKVRRCSVAGMIYGAPMTNGDAVDGESAVERHLSSSSLSSTAASDAMNQDWAEMSSISRFRDLSPGTERTMLLDFLRVMSACNTVMLMPDARTGELHVTDKQSLEKCLQAESADEVALVTAAVEFADVLLTHRDIRRISVHGLDKSLSDIDENETPESFKEWAGRSAMAVGRELNSVSSRGSAETYEVLAVNVFDSDRKRMSVLLRIEGEIVLLCKGADNSVLPLCAPNKYYEQCSIHIEQFATSGLRTLVFAKRTLSDAEATRWLGEFQAASNSLVNRPQMLFRCAEEIEQNLELLGAVGIEDELQDGVSESIRQLQDTGLNVWMITGDKAETALAISRICGLLRTGMEVEKIIGLKGQALRKRLTEVSDLLQNEYMTPEEELSLDMENGASSTSPSATLSNFFWDAANQLSSSIYSGSGQNSEDVHSMNQSAIISPLQSRMKKSPQLLALAVDGASLEAIWSDDTLQAQFHKIAHTIPTVIACRVSPLQKASLVRLVKTSPGKPVTLALGDGANDIGMIHEARIGVGISGREGKHAANSADFAIGQFRFIVPLLLEHGRYNYIRGSKLVLYSFFKNLVLVSTLFYYCNYSGFSGTVYLDSIVFSGFNFYLGLPIVMIGIWDKDVDIDTVYKHPKLAYQTGRLGELLSMSNFFRWCVSAFFQGMVLFAVAIRIITGSGAADQAYNTDYRSVEINNMHGRGGGIYVDGFFLYTCVVACMHMKVAYMTTTWTWIHWAMWILSMVGYIFFAWVYSQFEEVYDWYKIVDFAMGTGLFYLGILVVVWLLYMTETVLRMTSSVLFPTSQGRLLALEEQDRSNSKDSDNSERKQNISGTGISMPERKTLSI